MRQPRQLASFAAALAALTLLLALPAGASAAKPIKGKPKITDIEGFAYPTDFSLEHWRAGAVLITRYPKVVPKAFPQRIRKLLSYRAIGGLKVFDHGKRIASRKDKGGLPVYVAGHSVYYAHLLIATQKQSDRIFQAFGFERSKRGWPSAQNVHTRASANERVKAKGRTVASSGTKSAQSVNLVGAADPPSVIYGCFIYPGTKCSGGQITDADLPNVDLSNSLLNSMDLSGTNFSGANFSHSNFSDSGLQNANLTGANLYRAVFYYADFTGANLRGTNLDQSTYADALFCNTTMPDGSINNSDC